MARKVKNSAIIAMWTLTIALAMFWYYLPSVYGFLSDVFLILALICSAYTFRITVTKKA